ncbi:MAG TPA: cell division protein ZapA [Flavobacteriales bacterium]|jgi:cell division protein ZapA|nr:cell division protein ZapA [Flavobacteriales bacterium]HIB76398.1 cell division protein ZapA [Flavobacteriales bacterium]HIN42253.1 cell division protein ZapA [Flavobacteriales bacterium]HIO15706.1 cell division protein ZapA [Flavobacteriales bacterium]HIO60029.1 cell division protein ZapA [Flavobacteriales bacterium]
MSKETIDIKIAGRSYPLTVSPEEVQSIRDAATAVDERIGQLKSQFAVQDRIDLFAMTALQLSIRIKELESLPTGNSGRDTLNNLSDSTRDIEGENRAKEVVEDLLQRIQSAME